MSQGQGKPVEQKAKEIIISEKGTLIITRRVFDIISQMHVASIGKEWSGIIYYRVVEGDINDPATLVCEVVDVAPMNIGSSGYTEFDYDFNDPYALEFFDKKIADDSLIVGNIHTHHNFNTFFSGVDKDDLEENSRTNSGYLSLIVNHKHDIETLWCAKIGIFGTEEVEGFISTRKLYKRSIKYNSWNHTIDDDHDETQDQPVSFTQNILQVIDLVIKRSEDDDWSDVDRAIALQNTNGYTSNGVKSGTAYTGNLGTSHYQNQVNSANNKPTTTESSTQVNESREANFQIVKKLKDRGLKGGCLKEDNILHLIFEFVSDQVGISFTQMPNRAPNKTEVKAMLNYLDRITAGECHSLTEELDKNFSNIVEAFWYEYITVTNEPVVTIYPQDLRLIAKLILFTLIENGVKTTSRGYMAIKEGLRDYADFDIVQSKEIIGFLTKLPLTAIIRFTSLKVVYSDVPVSYVTSTSENSAYIYFNNWDLD